MTSQRPPSRPGHFAIRLASVVALLVASVVTAQDWPTYRGHAGRSGTTAASLPAELAPLWTQHLAAPTPAWPAPARGSYWQRLSSIEPRVVDDHADHPVIARNSVYLGSSADHHVRRLDLDTGRVLWSFCTGGPVRFAPLVVGERVIAGSDDGFVYCLDAESGRLLWSEQIGPTGDRIVGNGRLISPWPVRTGLVTDGELVFATAGLFPSQGVTATAIRVGDGTRVWSRSLEVSPQGYLLLAGELLILPTGRSTPVSLNTRDGSDGPGLGGAGGSYAIVEDDRLVSGRGNDNTLSGAPLQPGGKLVQFPGKHLAVTATRSYLLGRGTLVALDRAAVAGKTAEPAVAWTREVEDDESLTVSAGQVFVGGMGRVRRFDAESGRELPGLAVDGRALGVAISGGRLVVTTDTGFVGCFAAVGSSVSQPRTKPATPAGTQPPTQSVADLLGSLDSPRGFALVAGGADRAKIALALATESELHIAVVGHPGPALDAARRVCVESGLYGSRIVVVEMEDKRLPFTDAIFNLVVASDELSVSVAELRRVSVPGRGVLSLDGQVERIPPLEGVGSWTHQFANLENTANSGDTRTSSRLALQWYGGPGPSRMIDRHMRGPPPLALGGRLFIIGETRLIAVDSFNGTELWDLDLPDSQRYAMPYDAGYITATPDHLYAAVDKELWQINPATGEVTRRSPLPSPYARDFHVGYLGADAGTLFMTATKPSAHRTEPGRPLADIEYRSNQPLVTAGAFLALDERSLAVRWTRSRGAIIHPTITISDRAVYFVESRSDAVREHETGRIGLATLLEQDAWLVAIDREDGGLLWEQRLELPQARNILYLQHSRGRLILTACQDSPTDDAYYHIRAINAGDGQEVWRTEHTNLKPGELYHGEQVHHPVILGDLLVAEPYIYEIATGELVNPDGSEEAWTIKRPGHSCGTMSGSGDCLFFRAGNPTVLDLGGDVSAADRFSSLSPSRVGCWINILPVDGLVLIPESSSSCVCHYALQTSMGFRALPPSE